ncbi:hypothetical protein ACF3DV_10285 [Chlorogloeopsis fritschii PCC 9212]|uniref:hypothetical protein n=1 Tax=Chlorogloeopsis fritschii TaxID=1124 RepID=UPI0002EBAF2E|nr:hypothetical protein [Chlorogloeopsis fritschii]
MTSVVQVKGKVKEKPFLFTPTKLYILLVYGLIVLLTWAKLRFDAQYACDRQNPPDFKSQILHQLQQ